jgi:tripartite-type tricarboxylate transporter receptor subunit TctC
MEGEGWNALLTRAGTPAAIIDRLHREVLRIVALPDVQDRLEKAGVEIKTSDPEQLGRIIRDDTARWGQIIRDFGVKAEN